MGLNVSNELGGNTIALERCTVGEGTAATTINVGAVDYAIDGIAYNKSNEVSADFTAAATQAVSTSCLYLVQLDSSGTVSTVKGTEVTTANIGSTQFLEFPRPTPGRCPVGAIRVDTDASNTFTAGTTDLSATGITDTYYSLAGLPAALLTS